MRDYAIMTQGFWTGETGRALRGDPAAQVVAMYLVTCPSSNMIGLYHLEIPVMACETGLDLATTTKALRRVCETGFSSYDSDSETVFVPEMAKFQISDELTPRDKRVKGVEKTLLQMRKSRFCRDFLEKYGRRFSLDVQALEGALEPSATKPLPSQEQEQEQEQDQEQDQDQDHRNASHSSSAKADSQRLLRWERAFVERWNQTPGVVQNRGADLSTGRRKKFRTRVSDPGWVTSVKDALAKFPLRCFQDQADPWRPDVDWFLKPDSVAHILEGKYDWSRSHETTTQDQPGRVREAGRYEGISRYVASEAGDDGPGMPVVAGDLEDLGDNPSRAKEDTPATS